MKRIDKAVEMESKRKKPICREDILNGFCPEDFGMSSLCSESDKSQFGRCAECWNKECD